MKIFAKINKTSKVLLFIGTVLCTLSIILSLIFYLCAGRIGNYYQFMSVSNELIVLSRQLFSITALGSIVIEYASHSNSEN